METVRHQAGALAIAHREMINRLLDSIQKSEHAVSADSCPVQHFHADGSYGREITMPKGMVVVGKIHKHSHLNIISRGRVLVFTEQDGLQELCAPVTFVSKPYTQRVVYVQELTVWTTVHVTNKTDPADIEADIIAKDWEDV